MITHMSDPSRKALQNALRMNGFQNVNCEYFLQLPFILEISCIKVFNIYYLYRTSFMEMEKQRRKSVPTFNSVFQRKDVACCRNQE